MLYNFHDGPADLFERMRLNVTLNEDLGVHIWSFPMRYQPTDRPDRGHIGEKWTRYQLRSMQIILRATHGIVSGAPSFFKRAFGDTVDDYERILLMGHDFIFNRDWYERFDGKDRLTEYRSEFVKLDRYERTELLKLLSSCDPREFAGLDSRATTTQLKRVLRFYVPLSDEKLFCDLVQTEGTGPWRGGSRYRPSRRRAGRVMLDSITRRNRPHQLLPKPSERRGLQHDR